MIFYSAALLLGLVISSPWWLIRMITTQRYREGLWERLGAVPTRLSGFVQGKRIVWVHAVSVGEVLAASRLVTELEAALQTHISESSCGSPGWAVVISTTTRTGQTLARDRFGTERVFYYPLDFAWAVRAYLRALQPAALVLMESELWPRMLQECQRADMPVVVANARVSDRSFARGVKLRWMWGRVLQKVSLWLAQSPEDAERLVALGATPASVKAVGNLKYDVRAPKQSRVAELIKEAAAGRPIVVAGSTTASEERNVDAEESQVMHAWMTDALPLEAFLVLAPRHPERFDEVWKMAFDFPALKASELLAGKHPLEGTQRDYAGQDTFPADVVLLDTIGDLAAVYRIADVAYVGGSMVSRGGHNPLEPAQFGVPVVMGPHFQNFRNVVQSMQEADGIRIVADNENLGMLLKELLTNRPMARAIGERGRQVFEAQQGATVRSVAELVAIIDEYTRKGRID